MVPYRSKVEPELSLLVGTRGTGKTLLAKMTARAAVAQGTTVIVLDPRRDPEWFRITPYVYRDPVRFQEVAFKEDPDGNPETYSCLLVIDEIGKGGPEVKGMMVQVAGDIRWFGHPTLAIAHYWKQFPTVVRNTADRVFAYKQEHEGADLLRKERHPGFAVVTDLPKGTALVQDPDVGAGQELRRFVIF